MDRWREIDTASPQDAQAILRRACGSRRWVERMLSRRPFGSDAALQAAARHEWFALSENDWLEAFSYHPRIGDRALAPPEPAGEGGRAARFPDTHELSAREQSGVSGASSEVIDQLATANAAYLDRFGFIFIVCATGKTAAEMLQLLRDRLHHDRAAELRIAAEEQAKITALRLS
jgi:OHCU decarboxylase